LKPGYIKPVRLWILFDYYSTAGGDGYYSKESYINETFEEIPSYVSADGTIYNLRDSIDFRPIAINAQSTIQYRYSVTPSTSNFYGVLLPQNSSNFTNDYSYYLGRTINKSN
jgi:predicted GTPase